MLLGWRDLSPKGIGEDQGKRRYGEDPQEQYQPEVPIREIKGLLKE